MDLKQLLKEARQRIPPYLEQLESEVEQYQVIGGIRGCAYCGGLGHRITDCPKLQGDQNRNVGYTKRDILSGGGAW